MGEYEVFWGDYFLVLLTSSNLRFLLKKKDQKFKADIMGLPHIAGAPPPCRPNLPALPCLSLASPVERPCCLGSSRLCEACHPNVGLRASLGSMLCGAGQHVYNIILIFNNKPDSKRQQTTTVDYKRLINGFVLTRVASLRQSKLYYHVQTKEKPSKDQQKVQEYRENPYFCPE